MIKLYIKNMVCNRCIIVVKSELEKLGLNYLSVELGEVSFKNEISQEDKIEISKQLEILGFEILNDTNSKTIEKIKSTLIDLIQNKNNNIKDNFSDYLKEKLQQDYSKLSNLFSQIEGISIEKYFINLKIEKVKELIFYDELSLSEIAYSLNYSSVSHLSHQFKKVTGFSPTYFKKLKGNKRKEIDLL
ncbi:helix-turn-helix transcriptional regulator [Flavobacterium jejuense]|uniref:Helix-turn-helix transcriptional regulator n=1 Tax=Flavobacterium jejuense TaxID=1544455 RepID=A0ABX0ITQ1_9FLAO|nr:AraC family transcriptional regulator [Flavobacterium jejuense]NHN27275.1 helix-turn-helix transcriptional regulator [Flavobacterium jejuense]